MLLKQVIPQTLNFSETKEQDQFVDTIQACLKNDRRAQKNLYEMYFSKFMAHCLRYFSCRDKALEVLNHGFLKIFKSLKDFDTSRDFGAWGYRIIQRTALDYLRKEVRYELVQMNKNSLKASASPEVEESIEKEAVLRKLDILPVSSRTVFILYVFEEWKHKEIAEELGISVGTSRWHLKNAKEILLKNWKEDSHG
jgi:RNA polymerase sigma factor (sigma-70 family)